MSYLGYVKRKVQSFIVPRFLSYDRFDLLTVLRRLGIREGDALMVHSSVKPYSGFHGRPVDMIEVLKEAVTTRGILAMLSLTYNDSSKAFLMRGSPMNVRRSASQMGLLTEVFRRGKDVKRSLSPTHPVLAWGQRADWFISDHENCTVPFGVGSPFSKLLELNGKILCIDVPFEAITFTHFLEDRIRYLLPIPLYEPEPLIGKVIDNKGQQLEVPVYVISDIARAARREARLKSALIRAKVFRRIRIGNTHLMVACCRKMTDCVDRMTAQGETFFIT